MGNKTKEFFKYLGISILLYLPIMPLMFNLNHWFGRKFEGEIQVNTILTIIILFINIMNFYLMKRIKTKQGKKLVKIAIGLSLFLIISVGIYLYFNDIFESRELNSTFYIAVIILLNGLIGSAIWYKTGNEE